jgi:hypothetical protein
MKYSSLIAGAFVLAMSTAFAANRQIGAWIVQTEKDPFADKPLVIAILSNEETGAGFAIKCAPDGDFVIGLADPVHYASRDVGKLTSAKVRVDGGTILEARAVGPTNGLVQILDSAGLRTALLGAKKSIAIRVESSNLQFTYTFAANGAAAALTPIMKACPL